MPADEVARSAGCSRVAISRPTSLAIATVATAEAVCGSVGSATFGAWERYIQWPIAVADPQSSIDGVLGTFAHPLAVNHRPAMIGRTVRDRKARSNLGDFGLDQRMIISGIGIVTTGTVAIAKIDVLRVHAAELYVAPAIGEFFDCKCWRHQAESFFFGQWADVEHAHAMLATVRSAMEQEFADFFETGTGGENPRALAASFSKGMGQRISQRLRRLKAGRPATVLASGKDLAAAIAKLLPGASLTRARPSISTLAYAAGVEAGDRVELVGHGSRRGNGRLKPRTS